MMMVNLSQEPGLFWFQTQKFHLSFCALCLTFVLVKVHLVHLEMMLLGQKARRSKGKKVQKQVKEEQIWNQENQENGKKAIKKREEEIESEIETEIETKIKIGMPIEFLEREKEIE